MDALLLSVIIGIALFLFISEKIRVDIVALLIMSALIATGILSPSEAVQGFSNAATITVLFMFILSAALLKTGTLSQVGAFFGKMYLKNYTVGLITMMLTIALVSAFINNTPVVALFIPVLLQTAKDAKLSPGKLLMPLSFASIFGGMCTLIGTSTNVLVDGMARQNDVQGFEMFTLAPAGICMLITGMLYMAFVGKRLLPDRENKEKSNYYLRDYIAEIELFEEARSVNKMIRESPLVIEFGMDILEVIRGKEVV